MQADPTSCRLTLDGRVLTGFDRAWTKACEGFTSQEWCEGNPAGYFTGKVTEPTVFVF